jgi:hypothetical protein
MAFMTGRLCSNLDAWDKLGHAEVIAQNYDVDGMKITQRRWFA